MNNNSKTQHKDSEGESHLPASNIRGQIDAIHALEQKVLNLKQQLLLDSSVVEHDSTEEEHSFLILKAGGTVLATPIVYMDEVVQIPALLPVPEKNAAVCGLVNFHGEMIAVIDVANLINKEATPLDPNYALVICSVEQHRLALLVEEAIEVVTVKKEAVTASDKILPGVFKTAGILNINETETILILDVTWIALGIQLAGITSTDTITPKPKDKDNR